MLSLHDFFIDLVLQTLDDFFLVLHEPIHHPPRYVPIVLLLQRVLQVIGQSLLGLKRSCWIFNNINDDHSSHYFLHVLVVDEELA